jgi:DNA-binding transcriptional LysR family regulator
MDRIEDLRAFVAIVERGSLTGAARRLGRSLQSVSRSLAALEREIGVELVRRTTRRSSPTEAGRVLFRRLDAALAEINAAKAEASNRRAEPTGLLRITSSTAFAPLQMVPIVSSFLAAYPKVEIELDLSDHYVDLVENGFDLAVRIGDMPDSTLRARHLPIFAASYSHRLATSSGAAGRGCRVILSTTSASSAPRHAMLACGRSWSTASAKSSGLQVGFERAAH